jgi:hypothetical protein
MSPRRRSLYRYRVGLHDQTERVRQDTEAVQAQRDRIEEELRAELFGRFHNQYRLPESFGGGQVSLRLHGDDDDKAKRLNRTENLRAIAPGDPDFDGLYNRRNDAESINRHIEDTLWLGRAHSVGHLGQEADLLGFALLVELAHPRQIPRPRSDRRLAPNSLRMTRS